MAAAMASDLSETLLEQEANRKLNREALKNFLMSSLREQGNMRDRVTNSQPIPAAKLEIIQLIIPASDET
jgi:hypothetical protein